MDQLGAASCLIEQLEVQSVKAQVLFMPSHNPSGVCVIAWTGPPEILSGVPTVVKYSLMVYLGLMRVPETEHTIIELPKATCRSSDHHFDYGRYSNFNNYLSSLLLRIVSVTEDVRAMRTVQLRRRDSRREDMLA